MSIQEVASRKEVELEKILENQTLTLSSNKLASINPTLSLIFLVQMHKKYLSKFFSKVDYILFVRDYIFYYVKLVENNNVNFKSKMEIIS